MSQRTPTPIMGRAELNRRFLAIWADHVTGGYAVTEAERLKMVRGFTLDDCYEADALEMAATYIKDPIDPRRWRVQPAVRKAIHDRILEFHRQRQGE